MICRSWHQKGPLKSIYLKYLFQVAGKRDPEQEREAQAWIEQVIGERFPPVPYEIALRDGIILCKLMNRLAPGIISKINTSGGDYKMMDNLSQWVLPLRRNPKSVKRGPHALMVFFT